MNDKKSGSLWRDIMKPLIRGSIVGLIVTFIILLLMALVLTMKDFPAAVAAPMSTVSGGLGAFAGGIVTVKSYGKSGLQMGLATGLFMFIVVTLVAMIVSSVSFSLLSLFRLVVMLLAGAVGGVLGVNTRKKKKFV